MEDVKAVHLAQISVPQSDDGMHAEFADEETVHVTEGELQEHESLTLNVVVQIHIDAAHQVLQLLHHALNARLVRRIMILPFTTSVHSHLDAIQQTRDAVVRISFHFVQNGFVDGVPV